MMLSRRAMTYRALMLALLACCVVGTLTTERAQARSTPGTTASAQSATCLIHSLPAFVAQGEFADAATVADVIEVECNPFLYGTGAEVTVTAAQLYSRCHEVSWYIPNEGGVFREARGPSVHLRLDVDGNANVALIAGPKCMAGESLITLDENESPYETFTTSFQVLPAVNTPQGVSAIPASQVEDAESSAVVTIVEAEFGGASEARVRLAAQQLYDRCQKGEKLLWVRENREIISGPELVEAHALELDNNGNGFAIAIGSDSCAEGTSLIEADLEESPFTTLTTEFTVLPPQPTEEPSFSIEKSQEIRGSASGFTTTPLTASVGQTVDYQIVVTNTSNVAETFTGFTDAHCDAGTIAGGPGASSVPAGQSTTYTCDHQLNVGGTYLNEATVTGNTVGGRPLEKTSNQVEVTTITPMPSFTIEKLQRIAGSGGSFTTAQLTGAAGETVEYEVVLKNTGNVPLTFSSFTDPHCDAGTIAGGPGGSPVAPGGSTTFTCTHVLTSAPNFINVAAVTATPPGEEPIKLESHEVEVIVPKGPGSTPHPGSTPQGPPSSGVAPQTARGGVLARCEVSRPVLRGVSGPERGTFTARVSSSGIKQLTFYLDGRKLKTLKQSQARGRAFNLKIDARKLAYGVHRVAFKAMMTNSNCAENASSQVFVRPFAARVAPRFTG